MPHIAGKKVAKSHSTIIDEAKAILKYCASSQLVKKIVTGEIKVIKAGPSRLKITEIDAGLKLMVRGRSVRQEIFIYTEQQQLLSEQIQNIWDRNN